ncbi:heavy metal translocating P-type ATPase [Pontibacillus salicampi]|uniref:Cd(2+)-exporting ATPase n=1 Tax=Pontibacillus salicampi TaxID=1449801 RepID=A0ABV6LQA8_9BACI
MLQNQVVHHVSGRTRLKLTTKEPVPIVEARFRAYPGVYSAIVSPYSRTILLHHESSITPSELLSIYPKPKPSPILAITHPYKKDMAISLGALVIDLLFPMRSWLGIKVLLRPGAIASLYASRHILKQGTISMLKEHKPNADTLSATAIFASLCKGSPKSALVIMFMSTLSEIITEMTANRTRNYVRDMLHMDVAHVWKVIDEKEERKVSIYDIRAGDHIAVFEGEKISADGSIVGGWACVDESSITGEYVPKEVGMHDSVYAGTIVKSGNIRVQVERVGDETAVSRIVQMIEDAQLKKAPIQSHADHLSEKLVPLSFLLAGLLYLWTRSFDRVLNMLVIDFVCGLKLSTATAISASIGKAARSGALIKGGEYIEKLSTIDTAILDKTGTITIGKPKVTQVVPFNGFSEAEVIRYAASAEEHSSHPIAQAIVQHANHQTLVLPDHDHNHMEQVIGHGIKAIIGGKEVLVGNKRLLHTEKIDIHGLKFMDKQVKSANTVYVAIDRMIAGVLVMEDSIREGMKRTINQLRREGVDELVMITGDKQEVAQQVQRDLHLDAYFAEVLPHQKAEFVKRYKESGNTVMMVGDGINDAPALAYADIGVTLGEKRTDIAVEASDLVITSDNPAVLSDVIQLSKKTMKTIMYNFSITIAVNSAAILLGALGIIPPIVGAAIHNAATIGVVLNSTTLLFTEERREWTQPLPSSMTYLVDSA